MLEPGELPLTGKLPALKKKQVLKDPLNMPSSKSPLCRASPSNFNSMTSLQRLQGKDGEDYCFKDFYRAPAEEAHGRIMSKAKANNRLSWDMSNEEVFELDSNQMQQHESIIKDFDRWRDAGKPRDTCEVFSTTSNCYEKGDIGRGEGGGGGGGEGEDLQDYPSSIFRSNMQRQIPRLAKPSLDYSSKYRSVSAFSARTAHQTELVHDQNGWTHAGRRETQARVPNWPAAASFATEKRTAKKNPKHAFDSADQLLRHSQALLGKPEVMESKSMVAKSSQVTTAGPWKPCLAKGKRKHAQQPPRASASLAHSSAKSSALEKDPSAKPPHWSRPQDDFDSNVSTSSSVEEDGCDRFSQSDACENTKLRHCKQAESSCLQLAAADRKDLVVKEEKPRSLSQKYRPRVFGDIVGQHIVTQSLSNAILKGKIAPVYLFQGPRGTGKTSAARVFAAALLCNAPQEQRPCGHCEECVSVRSGRSSHVKEVDAASHNGIAKVKVLLEEVILAAASSHYTVFIIDECHVLTLETWNALLKILEEPPMNVVFILITTDPDPLPRTAVSRCQKFPFPKVKDANIIKRLINLTSHECLKLDLEVLKLIASRSDGSLRDAEMILDQLSLLGKEINSSTVHELVGSASDGRILSLLDSALLADTVNTIKRARELVDSGVQPPYLMSHMATLIIDILAGSYQFTEDQRRGFFRRQTLSEGKLERLRLAVRILSEAEKQLRISTDKMTWLTAVLLQLGPDRSRMFSLSGSGASIDVEHGATDTERVSVPQRHYRGDASVSISSHISIGREPLADEQSNDRPMMQSDAEVELVRNREHVKSNPASSTNTTTKGSLFTPGDLDEIWFSVVQICRPFRLRQSLHGNGKLVSISLSEVNASVHLEFSHPKHKTRCERSWKNVTSVFEEVLRCPVEVKCTLVCEYGIQQPGPVSCNLSEQSVRDDCISRGTTCSPDDVVTIQSSGGGVNNFLPNYSQHSSALAQVPISCTSMDIQCSRTRSLENNVNKLAHVSHGAFKGEASTWRIHNALSCLGTKEHLNEARLLSSEEQLDKAWICDAERSSSSSDMSHMSHGEISNQSGRYQDIETLPDMLPMKTLFMQEPHYINPHGWASEDITEIVELDVLSLDSHTFGLRDDPEEETRTVVDGGLDGCSGSESVSLEKKGITPLKAMQRLALRSRNRSLTETYQTSIEECGSPASAISGLPRTSRSSNGTKFSGDVSEQSTKSGSRILRAAPPLTNKLRGAAGNVAKFFQGKLLRNSKDTFAQCI